jgi:hypothetical protein
MSTGGPFPGEKRGRGVTPTTYPQLVRGQERVGSVPPLTVGACMTVAGQLHFLRLSS